MGGCVKAREDKDVKTEAVLTYKTFGVRRYNNGGGLIGGGVSGSALRCEPDYETTKIEAGTRRKCRNPDRGVPVKPGIVPQRGFDLRNSPSIPLPKGKGG